MSAQFTGIEGVPLWRESELADQGRDVQEGSGVADGAGANWRPPLGVQVVQLGAEEVRHLAELAPLFLDLVQLGGQQLALLAVVQGARDVRGGDGAELGEREAD